MKKTFRLTDTFNNSTISLHRTLDAAVRAQAKHSRLVRKTNGQSSYIPKRITEIVDGREIEINQL